MINDFKYDYVPVELERNINLIFKMRLFLGHYDVRVFVKDKAYLDIDRGSLAALWQLDYVTDDQYGCIGEIGQFCDFATSSKLIGGGEHQNELPVNVVMTNVPAYSVSIHNHQIKSLRPTDSGPFRIGNAVVLSADASVLSGAEVGDGAVVAANALVTGRLDRFTINGGVPARLIKNRFAEEVKDKITKVRWWDFETVYLGNNLDNLQSLAVDTVCAHKYRTYSPRLVLRMANHRSGNPLVSLLGFVDGNEQIPFAKSPANVQKYFSQIIGEGPYFWHPNIWEA